MKRLVLINILLLISVACQVSVPEKVKHDVSGNITTTNVISIQISIPQNIVDAFNGTCDSKCKDNADPTTCKTQCLAQQQTDYTNTLLQFINTINNTIHPPTPTPTP